MSELSERYRALSKHLSYLLRHHPGSGDLVLDDRGFVSLKSVLNSLEDTKHSWA
ncbi:MAG: RNA 2'-phosphotransferase, partial [Candidatus Natronoplasma sp.]